MTDNNGCPLDDIRLHDSLSEPANNASGKARGDMSDGMMAVLFKNIAQHLSSENYANTNRAGGSMLIPGKKLIMALLGMLFVTACGPDTIFVRPGLDTPAQHVANGNNLLERGKLDAAQREFQRASELDSNYVTAYIGLAIVACHQGRAEEGRSLLQKAERLAKSEDEKMKLDQGFTRFNKACGGL
jgi:tetratricopeptide (TPR) repeat protein